ncbi:hypothetical protein LF1_19140 [Rubripirellula obstinata]|uniref:Uncharacterized protein n=1 Tax=Rubripirellula obstinata TaxID=406547 RepID=A0A5B1CGR9_9BACT|nr:hypothetical protein LF1_19140 [Rubripirellula obstinata]
MLAPRLASTLHIPVRAHYAFQRRLDKKISDKKIGSMKPEWSFLRHGLGLIHCVVFVKSLAVA